MRGAAAFLVYCLYWTRSQGESGGVTENDITQMEVRSEIQGFKATSDQTNITPDIWAELKELRDMAVKHSVELTNSKNKMEKLEQENTAIQARLTASEIKNAVLESRMSTSENEVVKLKIKNAALNARLNTSENVMEQLQRENTVLEARLSTTEHTVEDLKNEIRVLEARMSSSEDKVEELQRQNADRPKVAFSFGLTNAGSVGPFDTDITLKFSKVITNFGQAYSPTTGLFTAPLRGAYYFSFSAMDVRRLIWSGVYLYHNDKRLLLNDGYNDEYGFYRVHSALILQLEKGDVVYLVLPATQGVHDDTNNHTRFNGFLLFPL